MHCIDFLLQKKYELLCYQHCVYIWKMFFAQTLIMGNPALLHRQHYDQRYYNQLN
jgi:hypothetical protein